jgi:hypothetical protein
MIAAVAAAVSVAACGVHKPVDRYRASSWTAPSREDVSLLGGPPRGDSMRQSDGFVLVGGPPLRAARTVRQTETVNGFELTSADDPDPAQAGAAKPDDGGPGQAVDVSQSAVRDPTGSTAIVRTMHASQSRPAAADPPAGEGAGLKALALWPMPSAAGAPPAEPDPKPQVVGQSPIQPGQVGMFLLCLLGAGGLWVWHRRCMRSPSAPPNPAPAP